MKPFLSLSLIVVVCFIACNKQDNSFNNPEPNNSGPIRFDNPFVGQQSRYRLLTGENYFLPASANDFVYHDDTLQLTIIGHDANGYIVEEKLIYKDSVPTWINYDKDSIYHFAFRIENDSVKFSKLSDNYLRSRIIHYGIAKSGLPLQSLTDQKTELVGWKTDLPYCECYRTAYAENFTLFGQHYNRLNVLIQNSPMQLDGPGETYAYEKQYGIVRASTYSWWTQNGIGWDLLP